MSWKKFIQISVAAYVVIFAVFLTVVTVGLILGVRYLHLRLNDNNQQEQRPQVNISVPSGAPVLGNDQAPVTIIEFADFQCPFCKAFHDEVFPSIKSNYIDTGKVKFIYQDFAFLGEESRAAAAAAKCAKDQDKFWPYHDLLYDRQDGENQGNFNPANLKAFAAELGLNTAEFNQCLDSGQHQADVVAETQGGEGYGVAATPTLFINGLKYEGVASVNEYAQVIELALQEAEKWLPNVAEYAII